jgi:hypothetical protein
MTSKLRLTPADPAQISFIPGDTPLLDSAHVSVSFSRPQCEDAESEQASLFADESAHQHWSK